MSSIAKEEHYDRYVGRIARGASISTLGTAIDWGMRFVTQLSLARMYGPAPLGFFTLGSTILTVAIVLSEFGMSQAVVRYVAEHQARKDPSRVRGTIMLTGGIAIALSLVLASLIFFGAGFLADKVFNKPFLEVVLKGFSVALPPYVMMNMALSATQGFQTMKYTSFVQQIVLPLVRFGFIIVFFLLGIEILGAVAATVLASVVGAVLALRYLNRIFPKLLDRGTPPVFDSRATFSVAGPMGVVSLTQYLNSWGAIAVVGVLAGAKGVGIYNVAASMGGFSAVMLVTFSGIFNPIVSDLYSRGRLDDLASLYQDVCSWIFTATLPVFLLTLLLARDIMAVFGEKFVTGWPVLVLIASAQLFNSSVGPTNRVLAMTGNQRVFMLAILGSAIVSLGGSAVLVPLYGIIGAGVATAAGVALLSIATVLVVHRLLKVWPYNRQYLKPFIAGGLAAGVVVLVRSVIPLPEGLPAMLVFSPLFLLGFAALRLALGLSANDRRFVEFVWTAMRRNRGA